jgi:hypothetical protein
MRRSLTTVTIILIVFSAAFARAEAPVASYIFPAGGQRGQILNVRVGGLFLHKSCFFEMLDPGVEASKQLHRIRTLWFEGPLLPLPVSQRAENYPQDLAGRIALQPDAPLGVRYWRLWTAQGATPAGKFIVGDLPEVVEEEIDGDPVPVDVKLPVTINGRIFPREDVDLWRFEASKGQAIRCEVHAARLGSPLDAHLEVLGPDGRRLAECDAVAGADPILHFTAPQAGKYQVRIHDIRMTGGQAYVYRLTITADPYVERTYPLGGRRGKKVALELTGQGLPASPVEIALPANGSADYVHRLSVSGHKTADVLLDLDDLEEYREAEPNDRPGEVKPLAVPAVFNGRIQQAGDVDHWAWQAKKGEAFELELRAARLGSPLDGVLTILDAQGKELARAESNGPAQPDPVLRFQALADGTYLVRVQDRFSSRGGPGFAYRLRIDHPGPPNFHLRLATDALTLPRGGKAKLKVQAERLGGFAGPISLAVDGLPKDVTMSPSAIAAGQPAVDINLQADKSAAIDACRLTIRGQATIHGKTITRTAEMPAVRGQLPLDTVLLAIAWPTPFKIKGDYQMRWVAQGTVFERRYKIERGDYDGPITVSLADRQARHLQGVTGPTIVVPPGTTECTYSAQLAPWMETGRTCRVCVMGVGVVKDAEGHEHEVSFSSVSPDDQMIAVVEPDPLSIDAARAMLTAVPGKTVMLPVRVARGKSLKGAVRVELVVPPHIRGISAETVVIGADQDRGQLSIRFGPGPLGPWNMPLTLRATLTDQGRPVLAETRVEILPED